MLIFVYGDDTFRVREKVQTLKKAFVDKFDQAGMNLEEFPREGEKLEVGLVFQSIRALPFLGEKRMTIIRGLVEQTKAADAKVWIEGLEKVPESTICILWETAEPKTIEKKALYKKLKDGSGIHFYPFPALQGSALTNWVSSRIQSRGGTIDRQALQVLVARVGGDLWQMDNEIAKLVSYAGQQMIDQVMIEKLVRASFEGQIFALVDAVSRKSTREAITLLKEERWSGANDFSIMGMLARQIRILIAARSLLDDNPHASKQDLANASGLHPFVAQKALQQARGFVLDDLLRTHDLLFEMDRDMKRGGVDAGLAVDLLVTQLMK